MISEQLKGEWTPDRVHSLSFDVQELCNLLNAIQKLPVERIKSVSVQKGGHIHLVFGDGSETILENRGIASKFLTSYINEREEFLAIMEHNRAGDPRITGEFTSLQQELKDAVREVRELTQEIATMKGR